MIYLDYAATSLKKPESVKNAVRRATAGLSANPGRGGHRYALRAAEAVYEARERIARYFGVASAAQVVFTKNATEALNLAIKGIARPGDEIVISPLEHNSVYRPARALAGERLRVAQIDLARPEEMAERFWEAVTPRTKLVVLTQQSNVNGYIMPVEAIALALRERGVPFVIDASQSAGVEPIDVERLGAAAVCTAGHKSLYGPQGTGLLLAGADTRFETVMEGGSGSKSERDEMPEELPERLEYGTLNVPGIVVLSAGITFVDDFGEEIRRNEYLMASEMVEGLASLGYRVLADFPPERRSAVVSFLEEGVPSELTAEKFERQGVALRAGLHCAPLAHRFLGTFETGTVRASVGAFTSFREIRRFLKIAERVRK